MHRRRKPLVMRNLDDMPVRIVLGKLTDSLSSYGAQGMRVAEKVDQ
jgi:hypothetical protein